ncbi:unnamed protein product [Rotaria sp. Silwood2]|nr:unnamed protein product [Rotaria sp. Silwood2]
MPVVGSVPALPSGPSLEPPQQQPKSDVNMPMMPSGKPTSGLTLPGNQPSVQISEAAASSSCINAPTTTIDTSAWGLLSFPEPLSTDKSYRTISLSKEAASFASRSGGSCLQSPIASKPKPSVKTPSQVSSLGGKKHGNIRVAAGEPRSSNDATLDEILSMDSTLFSTDQDVRCDEMCRNKMDMSTKKSVRYGKEERNDDDILNFTSESIESKFLMPEKTRQVEISRKRMKDVSTSDTSSCDLLLLDICPLGLGIEDIHGNMHTLIRRNTAIPTRTELYPIFTNAYAYQTTATIRIFEGEHNLTKYNILLGEFSLSGLTSNFAPQTLEIAIRMDIDANGILRVDAEEARSGVKASFTLGSDQQRLSKDDIERHITYVESDTNFAAKSVYDRKSNDPLYLLDGQITPVTRNFSAEFVTSFGQTTGAPLLIKLKNVRSSRTMIEELIKLQSEDGSFTLNKDLADILHVNADIFNGLEQYLREQGFNSLGVILLWLVLQIQDLQQNTCQFLFNIEQIKVN